MATSRTGGSLPFTGPAYAVAILFVLLPIVDTFSQTWPLNPSSPGWRYGTIGIGANYLISVLFGVLGLGALAALGRHRRTLRVLGILCGIATVVLLVAVIGFLLDAVQVRAGIPVGDGRTRSAFAIGAAKAAFKYVLSAAVMGWMALIAWKRSRALPREKSVETPVLVGEHEA